MQKYNLLGMLFCCLALVPAYGMRSSTGAYRPNIWTSVRMGDLENVRAWIERDLLSPDVTSGTYPGQPPRSTPLVEAIIAQQPAIVNYLISKNAQVNAVTPDGTTPLHRAAAGGNLEILYALLQNGANKSIEAKDIKGRTPLAVAIRAYKGMTTHLEGFETLHAVNDKDLFINEVLPRALHEFKLKDARKLNLEQLLAVIEVLRNAGAQVHTTDALGRTVEYYINTIAFMVPHERRKLLQALGLPYQERKTKYSFTQIPQAISIIDSLRKDAYVYSCIEQTLQLAQWTLEDAQKRRDHAEQILLLRLAVIVLAVAQEYIHNLNKHVSYPLMQRLNEVRDIIRGAIIELMGITAPAVSQPAAIVEQPAMTPMQPVSATSDELDDFLYVTLGTITNDSLVPVQLKFVSDASCSLGQAEIATAESSDYFKNLRISKKIQLYIKTFTEEYLLFITAHNTLAVLNQTTQTMQQERELTSFNTLADIVIDYGGTIELRIK